MHRTPRATDGVLKAKRKPRSCPRCGHAPVARVVYGFTPWLPGFDSGHLAIGGCDITPPKPAWHCVECNADIYKKEAR